MDITKQNAYFFRGLPCIFPFHWQFCIFISKYQAKGKKECDVSRLLRSHYITAQVAPDFLKALLGSTRPATQHHMPEDLHLHQYWCSNLRSNKFKIIFNRAERILYSSFNHVFCNFVHNVVVMLLFVEYFMSQFNYFHVVRSHTFQAKFIPP